MFLEGGGAALGAAEGVPVSVDVVGGYADVCCDGEELVIERVVVVGEDVDGGFELVGFVGEHRGASKKRGCDGLVGED